MLKYKILLLSGIFLFALILEARADIVLKLFSVNPSKDQTQKVEIKAYLPKEAKPEDIIDKGNLNVAYDTEQGSYYVYGEADLKPGETLETDIVLKDIWKVPKADMDYLRSESQKLAELLKNTEFAERVAFLKTSIDSKLNQVTENQKDSPSNPERHISDYRENIKIIESVRSDLALTRDLLGQAKTFPVATVWRLIIAVMIFLGVLGIVFYVIWTKQIKTISDESIFATKTVQDGAEAVKPARHEAGKGKEGS